MNQSFAKNPGSTVRSWRVFQIVFVDDNRLAYSGHREQTAAQRGRRSPSSSGTLPAAARLEAYLGLVIVLAFWGRLRGKLFGTSSWNKFPAEAVAAHPATEQNPSRDGLRDLVRTETDEIPEALKGDRFSVGPLRGREQQHQRLGFPQRCLKDDHCVVGRDREGVPIGEPQALESSRRTTR